MDVFSLSEALATACQIRGGGATEKSSPHSHQKLLVEEVKKAIAENNISLSISSSRDDEIKKVAKRNVCLFMKAALMVRGPYYLGPSAYY